MSAVNPESGITDPFRGALQRLFINNELLELRKAAQASQNVKPFRGLPCGPNPCSNGGLCVPQLNNFHCKCVTGYGGLWCDKCKFYCFTMFFDNFRKYIKYLVTLEI